jgi:glycerate kinase
MKIVLAPDKFKGCLSAREVAEAMARGVRSVVPGATIDVCPVADGGEGPVDALVAATGGRIETRRVTGPLPEMKVDAAFGILGDGQTAVVEMAAASGLHWLKPDERDPLATTSFGTGELLVEAAKLGVKQIILGIGGSATVDAGLGCAQACGLPVILDGGEPVSPTEPLCGRDLPSVVLVKHGRGSPVERVRIVVACDVTNPLYGPQGAAPVYGPQKGATPEVVRWLDDELRALAARVGKTVEANTPGAGAAGGLGFALLAWFGAKLQSGVELVIEVAQLTRRLSGADVCLTGEGRLDASSLHGKAPIGVARLCKRLGVPCAAVVGSAGDGAEAARAEGLSDYRALQDGATSLDESMRRAAELIERRTVELLAALAGGKGNLGYSGAPHFP